MPISVEPITCHIEDRYTSIRNTTLPQSTTLPVYIEEKLIPAIFKYQAEGHGDGDFIPFSKVIYDNVS